MNHWEFATANRIVFGNGFLKKVPELASQFGDRALIVCGSRKRHVEFLETELLKKGIESCYFSLAGEPTTETIAEGMLLGREKQCTLVIGVGGGSVIDAAKAIAAMITNQGELMQYLEVIGDGHPLTEDPVPMIAVPTTAGTGAEVTKNAVIGSKTHSVKVSMRHPLMLPVVAVIDPELTYELPPELTAMTGLDALTQVIEPFLSHHSNPLTDAICRQAIAVAAKALPRVYQNGNDAEAREQMAFVSLCGGLALANAKLGAVHGFAGPMGGMFPAPHGAICACLLPLVLEANWSALLERETGSKSLAKMKELAAMLTGKSAASVEEGIAWVQNLCAGMSIPSLGAWGISEDRIPEIVLKSKNSSSMKGNPIELNEVELAGIIRRAI